MSAACLESYIRAEETVRHSGIVARLGDPGHKFCERMDAIIELDSSERLEIVDAIVPRVCDIALRAAKDCSGIPEVRWLTDGGLTMDQEQDLAAGVATVLMEHIVKCLYHERGCTPGEFSDAFDASAS